MRALSNDCYTYATLLCLPRAVERLKKELAHLCERGLRIEPICFHPSELGSFGYNALLSYAMGGRSGGKPTWQGLVEALIATHGPALTPELLISKLEAQGYNTSVKGPLILQLQSLSKLVSPEASVLRHLAAPNPVFCLLEGSYLSEDLLVPLQVVLLRALMEPFGDDPFRWILIDEVTKLLSHPVMVRFFLKLAQEIRQRPVSLVANGQRVSGMPPAVLSLAGVVGVTHMDSPWDFHKLPELCALFRGVSFEDEVRTLEAGELLIGGNLATLRAYQERARRIRVRPTVTWAGGETMTAG